MLSWMEERANLGRMVVVELDGDRTLEHINDIYASEYSVLTIVVSSITSVAILMFSDDAKAESSMHLC